jgi:DNA-directed RNA polymerase subunit RPC12/RpoP
MVSMKHHCSDCESKFVIQYDERDCEDSPTYCPFCSSYIMEDEVEQDEDY